MKRLLQILCLLYVVQTAFAENGSVFLLNSGFEQASPTGAISGWFVNYWYETPIQKIGLVEQSSYKGKKALRIDLAETNPRGSFGISIHQRFAYSSSCESFKIRFAYRANSKVPMKVVISDEPDNGIPYVFETFETQNDDRWHQIEIVLSAGRFVPENVLWNGDDLWLELCIHGKPDSIPAVLYLDDVSVTAGSIKRPRYPVDQDLLQRFKKLIKSVNRIRKNDFKNAEIARLSLKLREFWEATSSLKKNLTLQQAATLKELVNWAEQKIGAYGEAKKSGSGNFKQCEFWVVKPITMKYVHPEQEVIDGRLTDTIAVPSARDQFSVASFIVRAKKPLKHLSVSMGKFRDAEGKEIPGIEADIKLIKWWYQDCGLVQQYVADPSIVKTMNLVDRTGLKQMIPELLLRDSSLIRTDLRKRANFVRLLPSDGKTVGEYARIDEVKGISAEMRHRLPDRDAEILQPLDIDKNINQQFWLVVRVPSDIGEGEYIAEIKLADSQGLIGVAKVKLRVLPFVLEKPYYISSMYYRAPNYGDNSQFPPSYDVKQISNQHRKELVDLRDHGIDAVRFSSAQGNLPLKDWPSLEDLKRKLDVRKSLGMRTDVVFLDYSTGNSTNPEYLDALRRKVAATVKLAKEYGIQDVYFYGLDEAKGQWLYSQRAAWEAVRQAGGKVYTAGDPREVFDSVGDLLDLFVCMGHPDREEVSRWHGAGKLICCYGNPQGGAELPDVYRRCYGMLLWQYDYDAAMTYVYHNAPIQSDGSLLTAWNDFCYNPDNSKQHMMVYPTADGVVGTLQLEGYREGVNDVRYVTTLENWLRKAQDQYSDSESVIAARRYLQTLKKGDVVMDKSDLDLIRNTITQHILSVMKEMEVCRK